MTVPGRLLWKTKSKILSILKPPRRHSASIYYTSLGYKHKESRVPAYKEFTAWWGRKTCKQEMRTQSWLAQVLNRIICGRAEGPGMNYNERQKRRLQEQGNSFL